MVKKNLKHLGLLVVLVLFISACSEKSETTEPQKERVTPVQVTQVTKGDIEAEKEIYGRAMPNTNSAIIPKSVGELVSLTIEKGDTVTKGQVVGKVDAGSINDNIRLQEIAVQQAQQQVESANLNKESAQKSLTNAQTQLDKAQENYDRMKNLYDSGAVSKSQYEDAKNGLDQAQIAVDNAKQQIKQTDIAIKQANLQVKQAQIQLNQTKDRMGDTEITANADGEVVSLNAKEGDMVSNTQPLATVVSLNPMKLQISVSAEELPLFEKGKAMNILVNPLNKKMAANITYISPVTDDSGLYPIEAEIPNPEKEIKAGMMITFELPTTLATNSLIIPTQALVEEGDQTFIYVVEDNHAVKKNITVVKTQSEQTAIEGDVQEGAQVIIKGQLTLSDGNQVSIMKEDQ